MAPNRSVLWLGGAAAGCLAILGSTFGLVPGLAIAIGSLLLLGHERDARVPLSGLLTGFGALWLLLLARESAEGGTLDDPEFWTAVGVVALLAGLGLLGAIVLPELKPTRR